jgi:UTP--glucose-1-phosphate uridylyltransferase
MHITQAVLPVAGLGTRFLPWTKVVPKELLPIGNKPIIALLVDECLTVGIEEICFVISPGKEAIPQYFYEHPELEAELQRRGKTHMLEDLQRYDNVKFHVVYQQEMKGDGHALLHARDWVKTDMVAVLFGDDLIVGDQNGLQQLVSAYDHLPAGEKPAMLCLQDVPKELVSKYGIVTPDHDAPKHHDRLLKVKGLVEKPKPEDAPSTLGIVGKYIVPKDIFNVLHLLEDGSKDGEVRLIDALIRELGNVHVYGYTFEGTRLDTGTPDGYKDAVRLLA